jgi:hypothetical protein
MKKKLQINKDIYNINFEENPSFNIEESFENNAFYYHKCIPNTFYFTSTKKIPDYRGKLCISNQSNRFLIEGRIENIEKNKYQINWNTAMLLQ